MAGPRLPPFRRPSRCRRSKPDIWAAPWQERQFFSRIATAARLVIESVCPGIETVTKLEQAASNTAIVLARWTLFPITDPLSKCTSAKRQPGLGERHGQHRLP